MRRVKKLVIVACTDCPYYKEEGYRDFCTEKDWELSDPDEIPPWCPLEDY